MYNLKQLWNHSSKNQKFKVWHMYWQMRSLEPPFWSVRHIFLNYLFRAQTGMFGAIEAAMEKRWQFKKTKLPCPKNLLTREGMDISMIPLLCTMIFAQEFGNAQWWRRWWIRLYERRWLVDNRHAPLMFCFANICIRPFYTSQLG